MCSLLQYIDRSETNLASLSGARWRNNCICGNNAAPTNMNNYVEISIGMSNNNFSGIFIWMAQFSSGWWYYYSSMRCMRLMCD